MANYFQFDIAGQAYGIPLKLYVERRRDVRFSIGRKFGILRLPMGVSKTFQQEQVENFKVWLVDNIEQTPRLAERFKVKQYVDGQVLRVGEHEYILHLDYRERKSHAGKINGKHVNLSLIADSGALDYSAAIPKLLSRLIGKHQKPAFSRRVLELNRLFFQQDILSINFKYNQSNWGSCSSKGNLNFSTKLLFAPIEVQDYVIIHELAHLIELNHSQRFWTLVANAMPDYKMKEQWLKKNGHLCDF